jgi:hypothetical protein
MAVLTAALAVGFWTLRNWARLVVLGMIEFSLLLLVSQLRPLLTAATAGAIILTLVRVVLLVLRLWYLFRRPVRDAFRMNPARATGV